MFLNGARCGEALLSTNAIPPAKGEKLRVWKRHQSHAVGLVFCERAMTSEAERRGAEMKGKAAGTGPNGGPGLRYKESTAADRAGGAPIAVKGSEIAPA